MGTFNEKYFGTNETPQSNIDNMLRPYETVFQRLKPNKKAYILSNVFHNLWITLIWLGFDGFVIGVMIASGVFLEAGFFSLFLIAFFAVHLTPVWIWLNGIIKAVKNVKHTEYVLTDQRILIREGVNTVDIHSLYYKEVYSINLRIGYLDDLLNVGDIYITGEYQSIVLFDIPNPKEICRLIRETAKNQKINYSNNGKTTLPKSY